MRGGLFRLHNSAPAGLNESRESLPNSDACM
jgi:hypothetical protein